MGDQYGSMKRSGAGVAASVRAGARAALRELQAGQRRLALERTSGVDPDSLIDLIEQELLYSSAYAGRRIAGTPAHRTPHSRPPYLAPDSPIVQSPSMAGRRKDAQGAFGLDAPPQGQIQLPAESRREVVGRIEGVRGPGTALRWDAQSAQRVRSGIIPPTGNVGSPNWGGGSMQQQVDPDMPWLTLRMRPNDSALGTAARIRVTAGSTQGGAENSRTFFIGGGFLGSFLLAGYDVVRIEVLERLQAGIQDVQFAWTREGMQAGAQALYYPERIQAGANQPVPSGAYEIIPNTTDVQFAWSNPIITGFSADTGITTNTRNPVLGSEYTASMANNVLWVLRSI